ncbi:MAG: vanadium-dependent haloperoxidase [Nitrospirota bacterium]|nr:vanadium-dependent haloperoxidase [Nitrospirota bacterium]MDP3597431.1 vanadium-dependent haloperoxidase [Nitrospirota bacterium]
MRKWSYQVVAIFSAGLWALGSMSVAQAADAAAQAADTVIVRWNDVTLQAIRDTHPGPPIVARMLAVTHTCIYDAWAPYDALAVGTQLGKTLRQPVAERTEANKKKAVSFAAYRALVDLFPTEQAKFDLVMAEMGFDPTDRSTDTHTASGVGNVACQAVLAFRHHDGSNQLGDLAPGPYADYTGYVPVNDPDHINDPNRWQPLRISNGQGGFVTQKFIAPHWGKVVPFALRSADQFSPKDPNFYPQESAQYLKQAKQVLAYSANLTDREKVIAEYWADGPSSELPPGHWALCAQFVSRRDHHTLDQDVKMFFAMTNAVLDASVSSWHAKRVFDYVRPVSAIHFLFAGQQVKAWAGPGLGTRLIDGAAWQPYQATTFVTPPFAEYVSGHSIFSTSAARVLKGFTGSDHFGFSVTIPAGSSRVEPGLVPANDITLSWKKFSDAANEAGISRRFGGIHFIDGDLQARKMGRKIGRQALRKATAYFNGTIGTPFDESGRSNKEDEAEDQVEDK